MQLLLAIDRPSLAAHPLAAMAAIDDDATLTQLATAWVGAFLVRRLPFLPLFLSGGSTSV